MRAHGKITRWNDDRGFGFIAPAGSTSDLFVHISSFPKGGTRPQVGELISFMVETGPDGRQRAVSVMRPGQRAVQSPGARRKPQHRAGRKLARSLTLLLIAGLGIYAWSEFKSRAELPEAPGLVPNESARFSCDGRTMCSQMSSCAEAKYFIRNCPGTQMDGNGDGEPCESQWCN